MLWQERIFCVALSAHFSLGRYGLYYGLLKISCRGADKTWLLREKPKASLAFKVVIQTFLTFDHICEVKEDDCKP